ncbi:MAG TPA: trigger factor [Tepidisphaeraceae bacterium]|jgi:trigger factor
MAENEAAGVAEQQKEEFLYPVRIEDSGPGTKRVSVDIPKEKISSELEKQFKELRQQAAIPGFRVGHAPQKLIQKRFNNDVKEQVRRSLISESYQQAVEKNNLSVLGEPEFEDPDAIKLIEDAPITYSFTVEVQPEFTLPDVSSLKVRKPKIEIKEENVDQAMRNLREQQGVLAPVEDRGVEENDYLTADVHVQVDGNVVAHQHDSQLVVRPGRLAGIQIDDLVAQLTGMKPGETRTIKAHSPATHQSEELRDKDVEIEIALKDFKRLELAEVDQAFLEDLGFDNEADLRGALREQMEEKITSDIQTAMREQVNQYLLDNTQIELPAKLSDKQTDRIISRRAVDLMMRGMPRDQIEANLERLRSGAKDEAGRELKLFFILQKLAEQEAVQVDESELNGRIAMLAAQGGQRPEKMKQEMSKDGSLLSLYVQMREHKAIDQVLGKSQVEEVSIEDEAKKE